jgi:hypothetical protein
MRRGSGKGGRADGLDAAGPMGGASLALSNCCSVICDLRRGGYSAAGMAARTGDTASPTSLQPLPG